MLAMCTAPHDSNHVQQYFGWGNNKHRVQNFKVFAKQSKRLSDNSKSQHIL